MGLTWASRYLSIALSYRTPKYAEVRDWRLGLVHRAMQASCCIYVLGYVILYNGKHLKEVPVSGYVRLDIETPTKDDCSIYEASCELDLRPLSELPYCTQGKEFNDDGQRRCVYLDAFDLAPSWPTPNSLFVPTFTNRLPQKKADEPSEMNDWSIEHAWVSEDGAQQDPTFIADVESFHVLISHTYQSAIEPGSSLMGRSQVTDGALDAGEAAAAHGADVLRQRFGQEAMESIMGGRHPRGRMRLAGSTAAEASEIPEVSGQNPDFSTLKRTEWGDRISIRDLLKLANPLGAEVVLSERGEENMPRRERGGILALSIEYSNYAPFDFWGRSAPHYVISGRLLPMQWYYQWYAAPSEAKAAWPADGNSEAPRDSDRRQIVGHQGLLITAHLHGSVRRFDSMSLLMAVATAAVLLAVAGNATDWLMAVITDYAQRYALLRSDRSSSHEFRRLHAAVSSELETRAVPKEGAPGGTSENSDDTSRELLVLLRRLEQRLADGASGDEGLDDRFERSPADDAHVPGQRLETLGDARSVALVAPL